jgi:protocatechuate 3,4-dioxygenase beta subunit
MNRREFIELSVTLAVASQFFPSIDDLSSRIQIAPRGEPGERLIVTGRTSVPGVEIFAYHTDAHGEYRRSLAGVARLHGRLRTAADGTYSIDTIKPGAYPGRGIAAHIHFQLRPRGAPEIHTALMFEGDPFLTPDYIAKYREEVRPLVRGRDGVLHCTRDFRI